MEGSPLSFTLQNNRDRDADSNNELKQAVVNQISHSSRKFYMGLR
jgi:hypothetical protein